MAGTKTMWEDKDGTLIAVSAMSDTHLVNAIRMLRRNAPAAKAEAICVGYSVLTGLQGEMAIDSVERDLAQVEDMSLDEFISESVPTFETMLEEAEKRGLKP